MTSIRPIAVGLVEMSEASPRKSNVCTPAAKVVRKMCVDATFSAGGNATSVNDWASTEDPSMKISLVNEGGVPDAAATAIVAVMHT